MPLSFLLLPLLAGQGDYSKTWTQVSTAIRNGFYARDTEKAELDRLLKQYGPQASAATSRAEFSKVVNTMIGDFHASHFAFLTDDDQGYYLMDALLRADRAATMPEFGAWFASGPNGNTVTMVLDGSSAQTAGLRKGDVILKVNDQLFSPIASIRPLVDVDATLTVQRGSQTLTAKVHVEKETALDMFLDASRNSTKVLERNGRKIGYYHLWTQAGNRFRDSLSGAVYGKLRDTDAMILDLRDGFGGRPEGYADPFFRPDVWLDWKSGPKEDQKELFGYGRPLVVLINEGSRSAKEVLSYILKNSHRAKLIGHTTAGNVLGTSPARINDWSFLEIPLVDVTVAGVRLENNGVTPDVPVEPQYDANGGDRVLEAALASLANVPLYKHAG